MEPKGKTLSLRRAEGNSLSSSFQSKKDLPSIKSIHAVQSSKRESERQLRAVRSLQAWRKRARRASLSPPRHTLHTKETRSLTLSVCKERRDSPIWVSERKSVGVLDGQSLQRTKFLNILSTELKRSLELESIKALILCRREGKQTVFTYITRLKQEKFFSRPPERRWRVFWRTDSDRDRLRPSKRTIPSTSRGSGEDRVQTLTFSGLIERPAPAKEDCMQRFAPS